MYKVVIIRKLNFVIPGVLVSSWQKNRIQSHRRTFVFAFLVVLFSLLTVESFTQQRFPKPEFESGHTQPPTLTPEPRAGWLEITDVVVLVGALALMTWLLLKKRSRKGVFWLSLFSLAYFGFYRLGCVCSVGSFQNVTLGIFHPGYQIPYTVLAFFAAPLLFALYYGRVFCAGVCPLGAIQDLFVIKPYSVKSWANALLGLIPFIFLGLAVLYAATATDFIVCRYDPFVSIFRFDGTFFLFALGGVLLLTGIFIARPFCRFFCPYGAILNLFSRLSNKHMTITPTECIQCRLCENSCPFDAIQRPVAVNVNEHRKTAVRRLILLSLLIPVLVLAGGWTAYQYHENLARVHPKVRLANILLEKPETVSVEVEEEITAFRTSGQPLEELYTEAATIVSGFKTGSWILGAFIGLAFGLTLAGLTRFQYRTDYTPNKGSCLSCGRCMEYCPVRAGKEHEFKEE